MNRILLGIERAKALIVKKGLSPEKLSIVHKAMDMDLAEYCRFQEIKSVAVGGKLTLDEAQTIYGFLGTTPDHFNQQPLEVKWVLTEVFASLLK